VFSAESTFQRVFKNKNFLKFYTGNMVRLFNAKKIGNKDILLNTNIVARKNKIKDILLR
jgi:hypothetical protein